MYSKSEFKNKIENAISIAILGHIRPDGDCVGSCLGLYNYIIDNYENKVVDVFLEPIVDKFKFISGSDKIKHEPVDKIYDLAVSLDCSDRDRHGDFINIFPNAKDTICLDHHKSNLGFGNYFYCDSEASSTCEVLFRHLDYDKIGIECAKAIYLGIVHDTGVFKYQATSCETMKIAGELLNKGVNSQQIIDDTFYKVSYKQNKITGEALLNAKLFYEGKVICSCITTDIFEKYEATKSDTDGIIDKLRVTDGVEVAIFIYQLDDNKYKFSLRSVSYVDVSKIAVSYGGGGHMRAAGFEASGDYEEILSDILGKIEEDL